MDISNMVRDATLSKKVLADVNGALIAKKNIQIQIPFRYLAAKLATVGREVFTVGVFGVIYGDKYAVSNVPSMMQLTPSNMFADKIEGEEYYIFEFNEGETICPRLDLEVDDEAAYNLYDEFIGKAKIPWYCSYEDVGKCMADTYHYSGITLSQSNAPVELMVASISRDSDNFMTFYREVISDIDEQFKNPPTILAFRSIIVGTTNTMGKISGAYFDEGVVSALTYEGGPAGVENILRL